MSRRVWAGLALAVACAVTVAGPASAQAAREGGTGLGWDVPGPEGPGAAAAVGPGRMGTMERPGAVHPGAPPPDMGGRPMVGMPGPGGVGPGMRGPGPMMGMRGPGPGEWERLGLTDAQRRRLEGLRDEEQRKVIRLEADLRIAGLDLRKLVAGERLDLQLIGSQVDRIADLRAGIMKARMATRIKMRALLTAEQRAALRELRFGPPQVDAECPGPRGGFDEMQQRAPRGCPGEAGGGSPPPPPGDVDRAQPEGP